MNKCYKTQKAKFHSRIEALKRIEEIRKTSNRNKIPKRAYYCGACGKWHITSRTKPIETIKFNMSAGDLAKYEDYKKL